MSSIPASQLVAVNPSVLPPGGSSLDIIGLMLTTSAMVPIGTVQPFPDPDSVSNYFGASAPEVGMANIYFAGFVGADRLPGTLLFAQYNEDDVAAYLRGADLAPMTLEQLQALSGSLTVTMDGYPHVIASISFSADASFSAAAAAMESAFTNPTEASFTASLGATFTGTGTGTSLVASSVVGIISPGDVISGTGVPVGTKIVSGPSNGGAGTYITDQATTSNAASLTGASTVLNVTAVVSGDLAEGQTVAGAGVSGSPMITSQLTGSAGDLGHYRISGAAQSVASESMTSVATSITVTYDSVSGAFVFTSGVEGNDSLAAFATGTLAAPLKLTSATGAVISQGADAAVPGTFMDALIQQNDAWTTFDTLFDPDNGSGSTQKEAFAAWNSSKNNRYAYVAWDIDLGPTQSSPDSGCFVQQLILANDSGTCPIWAQDDTSGPQKAAFVMGAAASIDFTEIDGRITFAFRQQAGLLADVTSASVALNLGGDPQGSGRGNGYNFYGTYGQANSDFTWLQRGFVTGKFSWFDSYINQVWLNQGFKSDLLNLMGNSKSLPYGDVGNSKIEAALLDRINQALAFGMFGPGALSASQIQSVNSAAGASVADTIATQGWYLQILPGTPTTRAARTSPPAKFWYLDQGSIQAITLDSVALQ